MKEYQELNIKKVSLFDNFVISNLSICCLLYIKLSLKFILNFLGLKTYSFRKDSVMNDILKKSWSSFTKDSANNYLKGFGNGSDYSKQIVSNILEKMSINDKNLSVIEFGCGNAQLLTTILENDIVLNYTGVDFSRSLLDVARKNFSSHNFDFILDDIENLTNIKKRYTVGIYSHVIEMLSSPEKFLMHAKSLCDILIIRFFEPPKYKYYTVELKNMLISENSEIQKPYLRRKISKDFYRYILTKLECSKVDIYVDHTSNDEVHVLYFK
jgi:ubiquinone/menaquinone biosynthesis C-methylase UbiE